MYFVLLLYFPSDSVSTDRFSLFAFVIMPLLEYYHYGMQPDFFFWQILLVCSFYSQEMYKIPIKDYQQISKQMPLYVFAVIFRF